MSVRSSTWKSDGIDLSFTPASSHRLARKKRARETRTRNRRPISFVSHSISRTQDHCSQPIWLGQGLTHDFRYWAISVLICHGKTRGRLGIFNYLQRGDKWGVSQ